MQDTAGDGAELFNLFVTTLDAEVGATRYAKTAIFARKNANRMNQYFHVSLWLNIASASRLLPKNKAKASRVGK
jgi:hypothetical protein